VPFQNFASIPQPSLSDETEILYNHGEQRVLLISRNTKSGIYLDAIHSSPTCTAIVESTPTPNAVNRFEELDREETCQLSLAGDMVMMLIQGILKRCEGVEKGLDEVESLGLEVS
jgi:hypothetical protein